jgi:hypothetical protein
MEPQRDNTNLGMPTPLPSAPSLPPASSGVAQYPLPSNTATSGAPVAAEDSDMIEQEWVAAVKRTLEQYKNDPYSLSRAMTALRQDYLQKRYGRTVEAAK